jgi:FkbM family methyltransferase
MLLTIRALCYPFKKHSPEADVERDLPGGEGLEKQEVYRILNEAYFGENCDERDLFAQIEPMIRQANHFVDIGASLGQYTRFASQVMKPGTRIMAIEADPVRFEELQRNCSQWQQGSGVEVDARFGAVTDSEGPVRFFSTGSNISGGLFQHATDAGDIEWNEIEAPGFTLDALFPDAPPSFVKVDVEGAELRVLRGAERVLAARETIFFIEVHSWPDPEGQANPEQVLAHMRDRGYHCASLRGKCVFHPDSMTALGLATKSKFRGALRRLGFAD